MLALALKYRPQTFDDVVEQKEIVQILQEQIKTKTHKNCYLFTGGAGTGKTTTARIFARALNDNKGNTIEIDGASNNGVADVRQIIEKAKFKALDATYKVFLVDEVHMITTAGWNAMLKLIEEPPAQTIFIFCTTDPQKIPATILSRVQRYDFKRITYNSIVARLKYITEQEGIVAEEEALGYIAKIADGGMRDAITLLDKCVSFSSELNIANVTTALGIVDYDTFIKLLEAIIDGDTAGAMLLLEETYRSGADLKQFIIQFRTFLLDLVKLNLTKTYNYTKIPSTYSSKLEQLCNELEFNKWLLKQVLLLSNDIKWGTEVKDLIECKLLEWCEIE